MSDDLDTIRRELEARAKAKAKERLGLIVATVLVVVAIVGGMTRSSAELICGTTCDVGVSQWIA